MPYRSTIFRMILPFDLSYRRSHVILAIAGTILAFDPAIWLINTWRDPAYGSAGFVVFVATLGLLIWSLSSARCGPSKADRRGIAIGVLAFSAAVRLASQVLAINTIGAVCLIADVYAVGVLLALDQRRRAISPFWLAVAFAFSLPVERILQRVIGYPLQLLSADGACSLLSTVYSDLVCESTRLVVNGADVLVDLPCSGAGTLMLSLLGLALASSICRPTWVQAAVGLVLTLTSAAAANVLRITTLAVGLVDPDILGGIDVMDQPWHDLIGVGALLIVCVLLLIWCRHLTPTSRPQTSGVGTSTIPSRIANDGWWLVAPVAPRRSRPVPLGVGVVGLAVALLIVHLPRTAVDISESSPPAELPLSLNGVTRIEVPLSEREGRFFTQFGGWARKANYGQHSLMLVRTTSPLRHLHAPEDCLRGLGFDVQYLGVVYHPVPTAAYRATTPDGVRYRVDVTFISERTITTNVATAVWHWLQNGARVWTAVQRISHEDVAHIERAGFDRAVWAALDFSHPRSPTTDHGLAERRLKP